MMAAPSRQYQEHENATFSLSDVLQLRTTGRKARGCCPIHGGDNPTAFEIDLDTGRGHCFTHGCWGYLDTSRKERPFVPAQRTPRRSSPPVIDAPAPIAPVRDDLVDLLAGYQAALPGSIGERYLAERGISLEVAQHYGLGYAAAGAWIHQSRDWRHGRIVVPHTDPSGQLISLYGRAVALEGDAPKGQRHDHLPGNKAYFNAAAIGDGDGPVIVCEGAFDALSLIAAGYPRAVAVFGADHFRPAWFAGVDELLIATDADDTGQTAARKIAERATAQLGCQVWVMTPADLAGAKDLSELWQRDGRIALGAVGISANLPEKDRWTVDPRPDLAADHEAWEVFLSIAYDADGVDQNGCFGVLHGLRCCGVGLERGDDGRWRLVAGDMDPDEYADDRQAWLMSRRRQLAELLRRLEVAT